MDVKDGTQRGEMTAGTFLGDALPSEVVPVRQSNGAIKGIIRTGNGATATKDLINMRSTKLQRKMWREIIRE